MTAGEWALRECQVQARLELENQLRAFVNKHRLSSVDVQVVWTSDGEGWVFGAGASLDGTKAAVRQWKQFAEPLRIGPGRSGTSRTSASRTFKLRRVGDECQVTLIVDEPIGSTLELSETSHEIDDLAAKCFALATLLIVPEPSTWLDAAQIANCDLLTMLYVLHQSGASSAILWFTSSAPGVRNTLHPIRTVGLRTPLKRRAPLQIPFGTGVAGKAAESQRPVVLAGDVLQRDSRSPDLVRAEGWKICQTVPLVFAGDTVGALSLYSRRPDWLPDPRALDGLIPIATLHAARRSREASREQDADRLMKGAMRLQAGLTMVGFVHDLAFNAKRVYDWAVQLREPLETLSARAGLTATVADMIQAAELVGKLTSLMDKLTLGQEDRESKVELHTKLQALAPLLQRLDPRIEVRIDGQAVVKGPDSLVERTVLNLVVNSLNWTDKSTRRISVRLSRAAGANVAVLEVTDNGKGIPEDKLEIVRQPFESFRENGSGLGLYLVDQLCAQVGARMTITSTQYQMTAVRISYLKLVDGVS